MFPDVPHFSLNMWMDNYITTAQVNKSQLKSTCVNMKNDWRNSRGSLRQKEKKEKEKKEKIEEERRREKNERTINEQN